jgi:hypothetical protein
MDTNTLTRITFRLRDGPDIYERICLSKDAEEEWKKMKQYDPELRMIAMSEFETKEE